ncbi:TlpA family protein disulfide reductase [Thermoactinomyces mirandus]|uniref:TlpA family protein disulfide reductase n=1 Tax=Thermoactinomyces mirandus TaxID=2756294 RepID=A0A7W1XQQ2_9BACL|nr:TlpA disulfide reductase family protein [Thermoactinomyces mirandus]MBA4601554.1 TlpA family protein disulfide reductase [Thermoactinomyces mirandus]
MKATEFSLPDLSGKIHQLGNYRGQIVWLEFWVSWCAACQVSLSNRNVLYCSLNTREVAFLTINVTGREANPDRVRDFIKRAGFQFPVLCDRGTETYDAYNISSVPADVLITPQGEIHGIYDETVPLTSIIQEVGFLLSKS